MKFLIVFALATLALASGKEMCAGCPETMDMQEATDVLKTTFEKLSTLEGPYYTYSTIHSATKQVVAGVLYSINVDLTDEDNNTEACDVDILEQEWMGTTEVTFDCPNEPEVEKSYQAKN